MTNAYIGEIRPFGFNFAPRSWQTCSGQLLSIAQNTALFSILGTTYGGNGTTTFGLPDLRGRVGMGVGQGPGLSNYVLGQVTGVENVTLTSNEIPGHTHAPSTRIKPGTADGRRVPVAGDFLTRLNVTTTAPGLIWRAPPLTSPTTLNAAAVGIAGGSQAHTNLQPTLAVNYCICTQGIFPSRN